MRSTPYENAAGTRYRNVRSGTHMVTVTRAVTIDGERLRPGRDRFAPSHPTVLANPRAFRAADPKDTATRTELRQAVQRSGRRAGVAVPRRAGARLPSATTPSYRLP